jgi:hypothetical protein
LNEPVPEGLIVTISFLREKSARSSEEHLTSNEMPCQFFLKVSRLVEEDAHMDQKPDAPIIKNTNEARQAVTGQHVRYVLIVSSIGAIIALGVIWVVLSGHQ